MRRVWSIAILEEESSLPYTGAGRTLEEALAPVRFEKHGLTVAVFGVSFVQPEELLAATGKPGVLHLPEHEIELLEAMRREREAGAAVVAFVYWGEEYTERITESQRIWARKLIDAGAAAVVGTHSHHPQPFDTWKGRPILYSLGNLVFPGAGPNAGFRTAGLLRLEFGVSGRCVDWEVTRRRLPAQRD